MFIRGETHSARPRKITGWIVPLQPSYPPPSQLTHTETAIAFVWLFVCYFFVEGGGGFIMVLNLIQISIGAHSYRQTTNVKLLKHRGNYEERKMTQT